jgi:hypothetical protein
LYKTLVINNEDNQLDNPVDSDAGIDICCGKNKQRGTNSPSGIQEHWKLCTDVHYRHIRIPVKLSKIIDTPMKTMVTIDSYIKNVYHQSIMYFKDHQRGNIADKHQAHLAEQLIKDTSEFIKNVSTDQPSIY